MSRGTVLEGLLASLADADDATKRELAGYLEPYLGDPSGRLLDRAEKAAQLRLHPDTLGRMARDGRIWAVKIGREWRFRADRSEIRPILGDPFPTTNGVGPTRRPAKAAPTSVAAIRGTPITSDRRP
jgi:excisionase family DNA binding protein